MDKIILIGGAPTVGKSYVTRKIAEELNLPWISTDTVREQMREIVRKEDFPTLFRYSNPTAEMAVDFLTKKTAIEIVKSEIKESIDVWKGVKALIKTDYTWGSFIVEGVAIMPSLVAKLTVKNKKIIPIFLLEENDERIRKVVFTRGLWSAANTYPDEVKEKEVEWASTFNKYIKSEAKKYNLPTIEFDEKNLYIKKIKNLLSKNFK